MAGRGPAPKTKNRVRKDPHTQTILRKEVAQQPDLPPTDPNKMEWCEATRTWWAMWGDSPQAEHFSSTDWDFLLDTAITHQAVWCYGDVSMLGELRIRVAKFGATMEDRARLRMQFAAADDADAKRKPPEKPAVYGNLSLVTKKPS